MSDRSVSQRMAQRLVDALVGCFNLKPASAPDTEPENIAVPVTGEHTPGGAPIHPLVDASLILVNAALAGDHHKLDVNISEYRSKDTSYGSWIVTAQRVDAPAENDPQPTHNVQGRLS